LSRAWIAEAVGSANNNNLWERLRQTIQQPLGKVAPKPAKKYILFF